MIIPPGYSLGPRGYWYYQDSSGPYAIGSDGVPKLITNL